MFQHYRIILRGTDMKRKFHDFNILLQFGESTGDTTTKFMVVVTSLFNLVISSFPDMLYHVWTTLLIYNDGSDNVVQLCSFIKPWSLRSEHAWTSLSTTLFKLACSTRFTRPLLWPWYEFVIYRYVFVDVLQISIL